MKKGILIGIFAWLFCPNTHFGAEVLARRLSISFQNTPIKEAMDEVARLADFEWSYNTRILNAGQRVSFTAKDWTVREILREMLGEEYLFKSNGKYLILKRQKPPKSEVSGVIRSTNSGERLANVTVYDRKTLRATTTDSSGYYQLKVKKKTELVVVRLGYRDTILQVASISPRHQNLSLAPVPIPPQDSATLAESIVKSLRKAATELDYFFNTHLDKWHELNVPDTLQRRFQISFLPMLGTNHILSKKVENNVSVNVLAGQSAGVRYFEAAGLGNFTQKSVQGFQCAGLFNLNRGTCSGVQAAGVYNFTADTLKGAQLAGLVNIARQSNHFSLQAAGLINIFRHPNDTNLLQNAYQGVQLAGLVNTAQKVSGAQVSGLVNNVQFIHGPQVAGSVNVAKQVEGAQIAGLVNKSNHVEGIQVSGVVNTADELDGIQVAGIFNRAFKMRGLQIGLVNHAENLEGVQLGLINRSGKRVTFLINWQRKRTSKLE